MSQALILLGSAVLEVIGLNPREISWEITANWPGIPIFGSSPVYQATGLGDEKITLTLATRPHVLGGLDQWGTLQGHARNQDIIPYIRLNADFSGSFLGNVGITRLSSRESKLAPDGVGYRWEFTVELLNLGAQIF